MPFEFVDFDGGHGIRWRKDPLIGVGQSRWHKLEMRSLKLERDFAIDIRELECAIGSCFTCNKEFTKNDGAMVPPVVKEIGSQRNPAHSLTAVINDFD